MMHFNGNQIKQSLPMSECIDAMEDLYTNEEENIDRQPMRTVLRVDQDSVILTMPSLSTKLNRFAVKIVTEYKNNPANFSRPVQGGITVLMDSMNSNVLASFDSPMITAIRTGAVSGLATRYLSRKDSKSVAVIGSGQQARTILEAICCVRQIKNALVYSRTLGNAVQFANEMRRTLGISVEAVEDRTFALKNSDIIIVATNSAVPVIDWNEIPAGAHINSIGTLPERRELDLETVCNSALFADTKEGVLKEAGDVIHAIKIGKVTERHLLGTLSDLIKENIKGRSSVDQVTIFKSVGFALQDVYACAHVYNKSTSNSENA
ncbi:MAG: ornithine cyclodeaminase family protein [Nitrososphaerota archaeon]|nr:ornithine cyclodeaminase family protein [Nitrososphaerota archaeon]